MTKKKLTAYLAGKMSGLPNHGFPTFDLYRDVLNKETEYKVISPADLDRELGHDGSGPVITGEQLREVLTYDIDHLVKCDAIFLMPGWQESSGARMEAHIAKCLGLTLIQVQVAGDRQHNKVYLTFLADDDIPDGIPQNVS